LCHALQALSAAETPWEVQGLPLQLVESLRHKLDGLPVELYRRCIGVFAPLLARVFTAVGSTGHTPAGFTNGVIRVFHKAGPRTDPANYMPITLLNVDYRLLAKVLARRLRSVQGEVIGQEQTAFLPGRLMGENIMLLQLLPCALPSSSFAAAVFLDIRKAYDTISRPFLYQLLQVAGLGEGFLTWVRLLLDDTASCVCVNGHTSRLVPFTAGVRQGCPLAPQLYLFVAQALLIFLKCGGFGVKLGERVLTANQFADDCQVFLESPAEVPRLLQWLQVFKAASGQAINCSKTQLMLLGKAAQREWWVAVHVMQMVGLLRECRVLHWVEGLQPLLGLTWQAPGRAPCLWVLTAAGFTGRDVDGGPASSWGASRSCSHCCVRAVMLEEVLVAMAAALAAHGAASSGSSAFRSRGQARQRSGVQGRGVRGGTAVGSGCGRLCVA
jgi:hypothetical protein